MSTEISTFAAFKSSSSGLAFFGASSTKDPTEVLKISGKISAKPGTLKLPARFYSLTCRAISVIIVLIFISSDPIP